MQKVVSITSQGQITIPKEIRNHFGISNAIKATIEREGEKIIITPQMSFEDLAGSIKTDIKLSDKELREARNQFSKKWARKL